jgi:hypothetical protein
LSKLSGRVMPVSKVFLKGESMLGWGRDSDNPREASWRK